MELSTRVNGLKMSSTALDKRAGQMVQDMKGCMTKAVSMGEVNLFSPRRATTMVNLRKTKSVDLVITIGLMENTSLGSGSKIKWMDMVPLNGQMAVLMREIFNKIKEKGKEQ